MTSSLHSLLIQLGLSGPDTLESFHPRVRDREDVQALRCSRSGVIVLSGCEHIEDRHYRDQDGYSYWGARDRDASKMECFTDDRRRAEAFGPTVRNRRWLDVGTGAGGILDLLASQAAEAAAVEPQTPVREELSRCGYQVFPSIGEAPDAHYQVATLFHVLEHFPEPIESLQAIRSKMEPGGRLVVEVPHARDILLGLLNLEAFKAFTLWSEHLILHTRQSLEAFLSAAGFQGITVWGVQRYPLANHLHWLAREQPGGHREWGFLGSPELDQAYGQTLARLDWTDTLVAMAERP